MDDMPATPNLRAQHCMSTAPWREGAMTGLPAKPGIRPSCTHTSGTAHALDEVLWVTQAGTQAWLAESGLATDEGGFVAVHPTLESMSHPGVFAAGDCAAVLAHPREKAGVFAVRQGPPLAHNLRRALRGLPPRPFTPQRRYLSLISTGGRHAVATRGGALVFEGDWVWRWKDWIDRRFMRKFADLPDMADDAKLDLPSGLADGDAIRELSAVAMRCGGCGAKVGATVLARVMNRIEPVARDDVLIGLDDPDDAAVVETPPGKVVVHTVDSFRAMIDDPYIFGRIAANHSLRRPRWPSATLPYGIESKVEDTLAQMMTGATEVLREAGAALVGGHTSEGAELALGFAGERTHRTRGDSAQRRDVSGRPAHPYQAAGHRRPLRRGHAAPGRAVRGLLPRSKPCSSRTTPGRAACTGRGASACTDVTGFGLLGHLVEMIRASEADVGADVGGRRGARPGRDPFPGRRPWTPSLRASRVRSSRRTCACAVRCGITRRPRATRAGRCSSTRRPRAACSLRWPGARPRAASRNCARWAIRAPRSSGVFWPGATPRSR